MLETSLKKYLRSKRIMGSKLPISIFEILRICYCIMALWVTWNPLMLSHLRAYSIPCPDVTEKVSIDLLPDRGFDVPIDT